jgi:prophage regulatory protein
MRTRSPLELQPDSSIQHSHTSPDSSHRPERLLRFHGVQERVPYSHSTIYALVKQGKFPLPVSLGGRAVAWKESEIDAWIQSRSKVTRYAFVSRACLKRAGE